MGADRAGRAMLRAAALNADIGGADDFHHRTEVHPAFPDGSLQNLAVSLEAGDKTPLRDGLAFLERFPAGESSYPVFRDLHVGRPGMKGGIGLGKRENGNRLLSDGEHADFNFRVRVSVLKG